MVQFLLVRRDDLVHIGVQFSGFQLDQVATSGGSRPRLTAGAAATITLTFPPQALGERFAFPNDLGFRAFALRAGSSRVEFAVPAGSAAELTAKGVFTLLQVPGVKILNGGLTAAAAPTALEIPWRLLIKPIARTGANDPVFSRHPVLPTTSDSLVTGLWRAELRAADGDATDAGLALVGLEALEGELQAPAHLEIGLRRQIVELSQRVPANLHRLELSTIGGSLAVAGRWPGFEWDHDVIIGRDQKIRTVTGGVLYPFGHRVQVTVATERQFLVPPPVVAHPPTHPPGGPPHHPPEDPPDDPPDDPPPERPPAPKMAIAGLLGSGQLRVVEPVRRFDGNSPLGRQFPFQEVEILGRTFDILGSTSTQSDFIVEQPDGNMLLFPVRCAAANGDVMLHMPMVFLQDGGDPQTLDGHWKEVAGRMPLEAPPPTPTAVPAATAATVPGPPAAAPADLTGVAFALPGVAINMFPGSAGDGDPRDLHEVHELVIAAPLDGGAFHPIVKQFTAELPAVRTLQQLPSVQSRLAYTADFANGGADVALTALDAVGIDFRSRPERSGGLIAPKYDANAISRTMGPVPVAIAPETAFQDATLLGLPLMDIVQRDGFTPPTIVPTPGNPPGVSMTWTLKLKQSGPFVPAADGKAALTVTVAPPEGDSQTTCTVENFDFLLPPSGSGDTLVTLHFDSVVFTEVPGRHPDLAIHGLKLTFGGALQLLNDLLQKVQQHIDNNGPTVRALPSGISARYSLAIPSVQSGEFLLKNVAANFGVDVPFGPGGVTVALGFASRDNPFNLSIMALGGGGYVTIELGQNGTQLSRFEASMEFGATIAVNFLIVSAEVHALGGVRFGSDIPFEAYIRIGGSVELFGLVSVSIEMQIHLGYRSDDNALVGRATLVVDVDLTLFAESVTLDSGDWVLKGSDLPIPLPHLALHAEADAAPAAAAAPPPLDGLMQYVGAFAP